MSRRKLNVLGYFSPFNADVFASFRSLVYWLECNKIRCFPPEERNVLNDEVDDDSWKTAFKKYLTELRLEDSNSFLETADSLVNMALEFEVEDTQKELGVSDENMAQLGTPSASQLSQVDVSSPEFVSNVEELCHLLKIPFCRAEPLVSLRAVAILLRRIKSQNTDSAAAKKLPTEIESQILDAKFFKTANNKPQVNRMLNVLRLLYLSDLRDLQSSINSITVAIQTLTANPKTDSSLGKVGV